MDFRLLLLPLWHVRRSCAVGIGLSAPSSSLPNATSSPASVLYTIVGLPSNSGFLFGYSLRNTAIGSILLARRAGTYAATRAVMVMSPIDQAHVTGSRPRTSNKKLSMA